MSLSAFVNHNARRRTRGPVYPISCPAHTCPNINPPKTEGSWKMAL